MISNSLAMKRKFVNQLTLAICILITVLTLFFLFWILLMTFQQGLHGFTTMGTKIFTQNTPAPGSDGGLLNALVGSLIMVGLGILIGGPIGILAGTFLAEFGLNQKISQPVRFFNDVLLSAPSIITGLFIYALIVVPLKQFSGLAGAIALAMVALPIIVRTTDEMLRLVPGSLREAGLALGAPRWKVITSITYRSAAPGILTGLLLAIARISGETAPLLFTALNNQFWDTNIMRPIASLPVVIFQFAMSPYKGWQDLAWTGAFIAVSAVLALNILSRWILKRMKH